MNARDFSKIQPASQRQRWRRYRPQRRLTVGPLGLVVPIVNVALLAVMFLILKSGLVLRPGITLQLPQSEFTAGTHYNTMVLVMTQEGLIFFNDNRIPLEELAFALNQAAHRNRQAGLSIEADLRVQYGMVIRVINMAMAAGIRQINLAIRPAFGEELLP